MPWHRFPFQSRRNRLERLLVKSPWFVSESDENSSHSKFGFALTNRLCKLPVPLARARLKLMVTSATPYELPES